MTSRDVRTSGDPSSGGQGTGRAALASLPDVVRGSDMARLARAGLAAFCWPRDPEPTLRAPAARGHRTPHSARIEELRLGGELADQGRETIIPGEEERVVKVDAAYLELHVSFVRDRLKQAGIRLAYMPNTTVGR